ncbi:MAG: hypothetical protein D6718_01755 [Acidobacteria bacterium]|nr:MAG: hypothetical protein D6718_01755 [Acidobacteriota bacterium]
MKEAGRRDRERRPAVAAVPEAAPPRTPAPRVSWRAGGSDASVPLAAPEGPCLIPGGEHAAVLASLLIEALDRAAARADRTATLSRAGVTVEFAGGADWPDPSGRPSIVLGGGDAPGSAAELARRAARVEWVARALEALGPRDAERLRAYPRRRRALAARRRRLERRLVAWDDRRRRRSVRVRAGLGISAAGLAGSVACVAAGIPAGAAAGAALFFGGATLFALARVEPEGWEEERLRAEAELSQVAQEADALDEEAAALAKRLGLADPWEAAGRLEEIGSPRGAGVRDPREREETEAAARRLAAGAGEDPEAMAWERGWQEFSRPTGRGWPPEVAAPLGDAGPEASWLRAARLVARVARGLPAPWPVILWEPWPDREPEERARRLLALSRAVAPRPLLAVVGRPDR